MHMDSSDTDDENLDLFREAVDGQFINDDMYKNGSKQQENNDTPIQPPKEKSLRRNIPEEDESFNFFRVTPEFREHVSKQLTKILDRRLEEICYEPTISPQKAHKRKKSRVKLLRESTTPLKVTKRKETDVICKPRTENFSDNEEIESRCREVAVSGEDVLCKRDVRSWSTRSKAEVFVYKKNCEGQLVQENGTVFS